MKVMVEDWKGVVIWGTEEAGSKGREEEKTEGGGCSTCQTDTKQT